MFEHIAGGSADDKALRANNEALARYQIFSRVLKDCSNGSTSLSLFGERFAHPVLLAPVSYQRLVHQAGELAVAHAADALQTGMVVSTTASISMEKLAAALPDNKWFQLYFQPDRGLTLELVQRAERAGYSALVLTVDAPVSGLRNRAERAGFQLPAEIQAANLAGVEQLPLSVEAGQSRVFQGAMAMAPSWDDVTWLRSQTKLPLLLKGILHPDDARQALAVGADGIIVSNHGGRALDQAPATLDVLPEIRAAIGSTVPILADGGIRRGGDVFIYLANGANAVLIGRPQIYALAVGGAKGVARMLRLLRDELEITMALAGCAKLEDITASCLRNRAKVLS